MKASIFLLSTFLLFGITLRANECVPLYKEGSIQIAQSTVELKNKPKGLIKYTVEWGNGHREMELPSILHELRSNKNSNLKVVIFAGNTLYDGTYHNLAFHFADFLMSKNEVVKNYSNQKVYRKRLTIEYDDATSRKGVIDFLTQPGVFRSQSGEVVYQKQGNNTIVYIKPIGDYNEIGDFVVPVIEVLGVKAKNVFLVNDNLKIEEGEQFFERGPLNPEGNNSVFSVNRSLSYLTLKKVLKVFKNDKVFGSRLTNEDIQTFSETYIEAANLRSGSTAFKNIEAISMPVSKFLTTIVKNRIQQEIISEQESSFKHLSVRFGQLMRELKGSKEPLSPERTEALEKELEQLNAERAPYMKELKLQKNKIEQDYENLKLQITDVIYESLNYNRLNIGTGGPKEVGESLADHVLSRFPEDKFNEKYWEHTWNDLESLLNN